jgi:hypothetical protein
LRVPDRHALCREAGFSERKGREYIQIFEAWQLIVAARCQCIREALRDWPEIHAWFDGMLTCRTDSYRGGHLNIGDEKARQWSSRTG